MKLEYEILFNKFGQNLLSSRELTENFNLKDIMEKRLILNELIFLIQQSKPIDNDIDHAIEISTLKKTYSPCMMLKKGIAIYNLKKISLLPESELPKVFLLFISLFKVAYSRRYEIEKNHPDKWWYWDLSDEKNINKITQKYTEN